MTQIEKVHALSDLLKGALEGFPEKKGEIDYHVIEQAAMEVLKGHEHSATWQAEPWEISLYGNLIYGLNLTCRRDAEKKDICNFDLFLLPRGKNIALPDDLEAEAAGLFYQMYMKGYAICHLDCYTARGIADAK
ncbi:MAG: hypothetical protein M1353_07870 [Nitrospirae bacterium]|nr:hypothetical protein [Nitrospirota bacterium]